jgi:peptidoglycan hydrolase-like protein with peptidoglycan-binding domain
MADTVFDAALQARLLAFQKAHGLTADGLVSAKTWTELAAAPADTAATPAAAKSATAATTTPSTGPAASTQDTTTTGEPSGSSGSGEPVKPAGKVYTEQNAPTLFRIAQSCGDEESIRAFLRSEVGADLDEILRTIESVLAG